jgi:histidinol-phosphatase (PHP family)
MYSIHNHSDFCDGKSTVKEMIESACDKNINHFGLSGHAPVPFENKWSIKSKEKVKEYCEEIDKYKSRCISTKIWKGLEVDFIPGISDDFGFWLKNYDLDYLIGSVHLVKNNEQLWFIDGPAEGYDDGLKNIFGNDMHLAVKSFYNQTCEMIESQKFDILGHCDKVLMHNRNRFITFDDEFHLRFLKETLMLAKEKNVIVEINTRGIYRKLHNDYYPGKYIFKFLKENGIRVIMSADGHKNDQINLGFEQLQNAILLAGIHETWLPECMCKNPIPLI